MRDQTFYLANMLPLPGPRLDVGIRLYYRPIEAGSTLSAFTSLILQKLDGQDRLTEVGHSADGSVLQVLCGFVLSICYSIDTTLAIIGKFLSCSVGEAI